MQKPNKTQIAVKTNEKPKTVVAATTGEYLQPPYYGKMTLSGAVYEGIIASGKCHGWGVIGFDDGCRYIGEFYENSIHGWGTMIYPSGVVLMGKWVNGQLYFTGVQITNRVLYTNYKIQQQRHNNNNIIKTQPNIFIQWFPDESKPGVGMAYFSNGDWYIGEYSVQHSLYNGWGTLLNQYVLYYGKWGYNGLADKRGSFQIN